MDFLTGLSIFSNISGLYNLYSGIRYGNIPQKILDEIVQTKGIVEKLSEHLYYAESIEEVKDITKTPHTKLTDKRSVRELLTPFQESLGEDLLSTAVISTPEKLRQAYKKDPWEVLFSIRPLDRVKKPENPDAIPIIFYHNGIHYVGWQMKGTLPILFNFNYDSDKGMYLFSSTKERKERILNDSKQSNDPERIREKRKEKYPKSKPEIIESQPINYSKIFCFLAN